MHTVHIGVVVKSTVNVLKGVQVILRGAYKTSSPICVEFPHKLWADQQLACTHTLRMMGVNTFVTVVLSVRTHKIGLE